jgi:hypothetical protein
MLVGGRVVALKVLLCEKWCLIVFCGVSEGNRVLDERNVRCFEDCERTLVELVLIF